ncbi:NUDIX hydrolase [Streptomyces marincola]|uniref:DNA mismatch repair protein MutT n=1 Tax=Streptomyces marincola TaxID=2878388 RepID=A0A1W7D4I6_9ACTN|nr:NUDIX domain-containing protein [Streptomyces marincola]ARQ71914.1 DNA mismatch repair protein MutT [Streptomyces marincola]UCM86621.1 NUDIX domain-containing protein [Streptomyces marincola]
MTRLIDTVAWVLVENGRILGARSRGRELFYIPGGKREPGESDVQTLAREVREELAVTLDPESAVHVGTYTAQADGHPEGTLVRMACYTARHEGEPRASGEIEEIAWLAFADRHRTAPVDHAVFDDLAGAGRLR